MHRNSHSIVALHHEQNTADAMAYEFLTPRKQGEGVSAIAVRAFRLVRVTMDVNLRTDRSENGRGE
jgi:hypothetical protein